MKHNNSELGCFQCSQCRDDQEEVAACSQMADRECQCKQGTYCNSENCVEKCLRCSRCPNGRVIRQCNATMDTLCDTSDSESGKVLSPKLSLKMFTDWVVVAHAFSPSTREAEAGRSLSS
ncbi:hypothetical protein U0070_015189, partial [Myodes glareolus]